jgi:hypothetical protein
MGKESHREGFRVVSLFFHHLLFIIHVFRFCKYNTPFWFFAFRLFANRILSILIITTHLFRPFSVSSGILHRYCTLIPTCMY